MPLRVKWRYNTVQNSPPNARQPENRLLYSHCLTAPMQRLASHSTENPFQNLLPNLFSSFHHRPDHPLTGNTPNPCS